MQHFWGWTAMEQPQKPFAGDGSTPTAGNSRTVSFGRVLSQCFMRSGHLVAICGHVLPGEENILALLSYLPNLP